MIAKVIVNIPSSNTDQYYDYMIPSEFKDFAKVGSRVKVPFGNGDRVIMGFILELSKNSINLELKEVIEVVDYEPVLNSEQIELAKFIKSDAVCPLIRVLNLMIPDALRLKNKKYLTILDYNNIDPRLVELFNKNETIEYSTNLRQYDNIISKQIKLGNIHVSYDTLQVTKDKYVTKYILNPGFTYQNFSMLRSLRQKEFLEKIHNDYAKTANELSEEYEVNVSMIHTLCKKGFLDKISEKENRIKIRTIPVNKRIRKTNNNLVERLMDRIDFYSKPILFVPNTFSEQMDALLQIINKNIENKKNTVIFVPEVLNSYKIHSFITKETGLSVGLINSTFSSGETLDVYNEVKNDSYSVFVTTSKGALFPYENVGTYIMMDSESDNYYNDQSPRYDLHKVFDYRSNLTNAKSVRMSFVPTILEYTYALKGHLEIIENIEDNKQINNEVIDLKEELKFGNNSYISLKLLKLLQINKAKNKKSILIVNNKGYSSYVMCRSCGDIIKCSRCKTTMQYNKKNEMLICPACSNRISFNKKCSLCSKDSLKLGGVGIEQVEEELKKELPSLKVATLVTNNYEEFLNIQEELLDSNIDILITTSLFAKSISIDNIGLIGIVNIDSISKMADYDATYRAYSTLLYNKKILEEHQDAIQIIQTYNPNDGYINDYLTGNYHDYIKNEIVLRKILKNEPFYFVNRIIVKGKYETIFKEAQEIKQEIINQYNREVFIMGPTYNYQYAGVQLIIKHKINNISDFYQILYQKYQTTNTTLLIDKYPKYL